MILAVLDFIGRPQLLALKTLSILYRAVATREIELEREREREKERERKRERTNEKGREYRDECRWFCGIPVTQRNVISHIDSGIPRVSSGVASINPTSRAVVPEELFSTIETRIVRIAVRCTSKTIM